jgi:flagellar FliJ protein
MKKFSFRLQNVLELREREEEEKERLLGTATARLLSAKGALAMLEGKREQNQPGSDDESLVYMSGLYLARLLHEIEQAAQFVQQCEAEVEAAREEYIRAHRAAESLRKLRQKKLDEYNKALEAHEEKFLDEISTLRYSRDTKESR